MIGDLEVDIMDLRRRLFGDKNIWEYKVVATTKPVDVSLLNREGLDGWELVCRVTENHPRDGDINLWYFKRRQKV